MLGLMLSFTSAYLDYTIVATALPQIASDLRGFDRMDWVITVFLLTSTLSMPLYGKFSDIYGRKPAFLISLGLFMTASTTCGIADTMMELTAYRGLQGLGAGGMMTLAPMVIGDAFPVDQRAKYQGQLLTVGVAASTTGPLFGGLITDFLSWHWIFFVNIPIGLMAAICILIALDGKASAKRTPIDAPGIALLMIATTSLILALSLGGTEIKWKSIEMMALCAAFVVSAILLFFVERCSQAPFLPPRLLTKRAYISNIAAMGFSTTALFCSYMFMPLFYQIGAGASPTVAGLLMAPGAIGVVISTFFIGLFGISSARAAQLPVLGLVTTAIVFIGFAAISYGSEHIELIAATMFILGLGMGVVWPNITAGAQNAADPEDLGIATSIAFFFRWIGAALGGALAGAILSWQLHMRMPSVDSETALARLAGNTAPAADYMAFLAAFRPSIAIIFLMCAAITAAALGFVLWGKQKETKISTN